MSDHSPSPRELAEIVENTMREFNEAMQRRENLSIRIGKRTTQIIRLSMLSAVIVSTAMFYMIYTLSVQVETLATNSRLFEETLSKTSEIMDNVQQITGIIAKHAITADPKIDAIINDIAMATSKLPDIVEETRKSTNIILAELETAAKDLPEFYDDITADIDATLAIIKQLVIELNKVAVVAQKADSTLQNADQMIIEFTTTAASLNELAASTSNFLQDNEADLAQATRSMAQGGITLNQTLAQVNQLSVTLEQLSLNLNQLARELSQRPDSLLRGRQTRPGPGE